MSNPHLIVDGLSVAFRQKGILNQVVNAISFELQPGKAVALVGESGSGKSVTARSLVGLAGVNSEVIAQRLTFNGEDLLRSSERRWRELSSTFRILGRET
jgi:peptide/nickel transport system ATP-binding protein